MITIKNVRAIMTAPEGIDLVIVKVNTSEPGLVGHGCATFTQRPGAVAHAVDQYLAPLLEGRDASRIEDLWRLMNANSYWRGGPVLNNAISGVDMALWDIKGKRADMPVYQLLGGACRDRVDVYRHADGSSIPELIERANVLIGSGHRYVRCQLGGYGGAGAMTRSADAESSTESAGISAVRSGGASAAAGGPEAGGAAGGAGTAGARAAGGADRPVGGSGARGRSPLPVSPGPIPPADDRVAIDPARYMAMTVEMLQEARRALGGRVELLHDVHERVPVGELARYARALDDVGLFFLEDPVPPDQSAWLRDMRRHSVTPLALGELFTGPEQWLQIIADRLIDFIRVHVSHIGGITPARKLAAFCEAYGVRTAWHGPGDCSPFGHAANINLDFAVPNFGIQEMYEPTEIMDEIFPGVPKVTDGAVLPPERPGLGVDFVEELAVKYPPRLAPPKWTRTRSPDGTVIYP
ncbi:MAG: enolase C-terminal domain-like protein [bacterium]